MEMCFAVAGCLRGELMACDGKEGASFYFLVVLAEPVA